MRTAHVFGVAVALASSVVAVAQVPSSIPAKPADGEAQAQRAVKDLVYLYMLAGMCGHRLPGLQLREMDAKLWKLPVEAQRILRDAQAEGWKMFLKTPLQPHECDKLLLETSNDPQQHPNRSPQQP